MNITSTKRKAGDIILSEDHNSIVNDLTSLLKDLNSLDQKVNEIGSSGGGSTPVSASNTFVNVKDFGAKGDGGTDDTAAINAAIKYAFDNKLSNVVIPKGVYMIKAHTSDDSYAWYLEGVAGIQMKDNVNLLMSKETKLRAIPNGERAYTIIQCYGTKNNAIVGGTLTGTVGGNHKPNNQEKLGECGYGISCNGAENITIIDVYAEKCWGDGFNFQGIQRDGKWYTNKNIYMRKCTADANRRQGISVELMEHFIAEDCKFINTATIEGTAPMCGLDIEPWDLEYTNPMVKAVDCTFRRCSFNGNKLHGAIVMGKTTEQILFDDCTFEDNASMGLSSHTGVKGLTVRNSRFENKLKFYAGLVVDGLEDTLIENNIFIDTVPVIGEAKPFTGKVLFEGNKVFIGKTAKLMPTEAFPFNTPLACTNAEFRNNRVEVLQKLAFGTAIDIVVKGENALYEGNEFINLRMGLKVEGKNNSFIENKIHTTLFDAVTITGEKNKMIRNLITGPGGYFSILVHPKVADVTIFDNTIDEANVVKLPIGTNHEKYKGHTGLPAIGVGMVSPEEPKYSGSYPSKYNIRLGNNTHISFGDVSIDSIAINENIAKVSNTLPIDKKPSYKVGATAELPKNAMIGDQFFDLTAKKLKTCVKSSAYLTNGVLSAEAEWA